MSMDIQRKERKRRRGIGLCLGLLVSVLVACNDSNPEIGSSFFDEVSFELQTWDTLTLNFSTICLDSFSTSSPSRLMVGTATQGELGAITAESYFQMSSDTYTSFPTGKDYSFTEATLVFLYDGYYYGDTTVQTSWQIQELSEELEPDEDEDGDYTDLFNFSSFEVKESAGLPTVLGTTTFHPKPYTGDSIEIELDQEWGQALFEFLDEEDLDADMFKEYFYGLKLVSTSGESILGLGTDAVLRIYYQDHTDEDPEDKILNFQLNTADYYFNHLETDRSSTLLDLDRDEVRDSEDTDHRVYLEGGLGLAVKVEIPYLTSIIERDEELLIESVKLELPIFNTIPAENYMLQNLIVNRIDEDNDILESVNVSLALDVSSEFGYDRKYTIDITEFVEEQIQTNVEPNDDALLIRFEEDYFNNSVNHLIFPDQSGDEEESKLQLSVILLRQ